ncbi:hypothetical protein PFISCL1PPCAC_18687 [Pristionchus fissidentatus]|uniref:RING-type domain-containing protein n=1 Tax=Pristionchus fissidentatus TaxID=1538716 RepID=A0AAV5WAG1_9BILA|nr:hypothetical protein PFISCL1PPCAC_18687 [Pristionchus fissidentatus]
MVVCKLPKCSNLAAIPDGAVCDLHSVSHKAKLHDGSTASLSMQCVFCVVSWNHKSHPYARIENVPELEPTMSAGVDQEVLSEGRLTTAYPFHLSMVTEVEMTSMLSNLFSCCNGRVQFGAHDPTVRPCLLDCSHVVCSECWKTAKRTGVCPRCNERRPGSNNHKREVIDLQVILRRNLSLDYNVCAVREKLHHTNFMYDQRGNRVCTFCIVRNK